MPSKTKGPDWAAMWWQAFTAKLSAGGTPNDAGSAAEKALAAYGKRWGIDPPAAPRSPAGSGERKASGGVIARPSAPDPMRNY